MVIVGGGVAGHGAALGLRQTGATGPIILVGSEPHLPYDRPAISKAFLKGERSSVDLELGGSAGYEDLGIELRLGEQATSLDPDAHVVNLSSGELLAYSSVVVATGSEPVELALPGSSASEILTLRTIADAAKLRDRLKDKPRVAIIGAGLVGSEVAAAARSLSCDVTLLDARAEPLAAVLGTEMGHALGELHTRHGVELIMGATVGGFRVSGDRLDAVVLDDAREIPCDLALIAVGARAQVRVLQDAGAEIADGAVVDRRYRTSLQDVYAAGDIATWTHPLSDRSIRVEHYENALHQGHAAGLSVGGQAAPAVPPLPSFWTDQYDRSILWTGFAEPWDDVIFRGDLDALDVAAFYLRDGRIRAVAAVNRPRDLRHARRLIELGTIVTASHLSDATVDLRSLAP